MMVLSPRMRKVALRAAGAIDKYVKQRGRNTTVEALYLDDKAVGYLRIAGPEACPWCEKVSWMRDLYKTKDSAGAILKDGEEANRFHACCKCIVVPVFRRDGQLCYQDPETGKVEEFNLSKIRDQQPPPVPTQNHKNGSSILSKSVKTEGQLERELKRAWKPFKLNKTIEAYSAYRRILEDEFAGFEGLYEIEFGAKILAKEIPTARLAMSCGERLKFPRFISRDGGFDCILNEEFKADFKRPESSDPDQLRKLIEDSVNRQGTEIPIVDMSKAGFSFEDAINVCERLIKRNKIKGALIVNDTAQVSI